MFALIGLILAALLAVVLGLYRAHSPRAGHCGRLRLPVRPKPDGFFLRQRAPLRGHCSRDAGERSRPDFPSIR